MHSRFARSTIPEEKWGTTRTLGNVNPVHLQRIGKLTVCVGFIKVSLAFSCPFSIVKYDKRIYKIRLKVHFIFLMRLGVHGLQSGSRHVNFSSV